MGEGNLQQVTASAACPADRGHQAIQEKITEMSHPSSNCVSALTAHYFAIALAIFALSLAGSVAHGAENPAPPTLSPEQFVGRWSGEARNENDRSEIGFVFDQQKDGAVTVRLWLPEVNAYGAMLGTLRIEGDKASVPDWGIPLTLRNGELTGNLYQPELLFTVRRTSSLPDEPAIPEIPAGPAPSWTAKTGPLCATPTVVGDAVIVADTAGVIRSVNPRDGSIRWTRELGAPVFGRVAAAGSHLLVAADSGELFCLDVSTGRDVWRTRIGPAETKHVIPTHFGDMEWDFAGPDPVILDGVVYVAGSDHALRALDAATGALRWQFQAGERIRGGVCVAGGQIVFGSRDNFVYSVNQRDGQLHWKFDTGSPVNTAPVFASGRIVIGTRDRSRLFALDAETGRPVWSVYYWLSWVESTPALVDGTLYIGASDGARIRAIDASAGRVLWATKVWGWTWGTPLVVGDTIYYGTAGAPEYFVTQRASLGAIDRNTGALKWRRPLSSPPDRYVHGVAASLAICKDRIIVAGVDGWVAAYPLR